MIQVGIFFIVQNSIIVDKLSIYEAPRNELFIEFGEHYNFWLSFRPITKLEVLFKSHAYDFFPRGRVVYDIKSNQTSLFIDRCVRANTLSDITKQFELAGNQIKVRYDEHYQCHSCNRKFMDDSDDNFNLLD